MNIELIGSALFCGALLVLLGFAFNGLLAHYLVADAVEYDEVPEKDAVQYTLEFERYWTWAPTLSNLPRLLSARVKPVAFAAWHAGRKELERRPFNAA